MVNSIIILWVIGTIIVMALSFACHLMFKYNNIRKNGFVLMKNEHGEEFLVGYGDPP